MGQIRKGLKVLIVEDERDMAAAFARLLRRMGYHPLITLSGEEALEVIDREEPDLVLTDLRLPATDGLTVVRHARRGARKIPVIVCTAYVSGTSREALSAGAAVYLAKPFLAVELEAAVSRALAADSEGDGR